MRARLVFFNLDAGGCPPYACPDLNSKGIKNGDPLDSKEYDKPEIVDYGDLVELTAGASTGKFLDATFPVGTAAADLTFTNNP
jgi:hypothetical protein